MSREGHVYTQVPEKSEKRPRSSLLWANGVALVGIALLGVAMIVTRRLAFSSSSASVASQGELRELTLFDPCFIKGPCYKGVIWFPGSEFLGPGWYCKDRLAVKKTELFDECHIVAPCFYGAVWTGKRWECAVEDKKKVLKKYEELMQKLIEGPHRGDKIWAIEALDKELPKLPTSCPDRGYQAPKKCRMIGMDHGKLMLSVEKSTILFDLVVCEDPEMRGRASSVLYNIVTDHQANLKVLVKKMGGLEKLIQDFNPETNTTEKRRGKALFGLNMLASECKALSPDLCDFFSPLTTMNSTGLSQLVWRPPKGCGWQLQVALQEAWVSSCTVKQGLPSVEDYQACGGRYLKNLTNGTEEQVYATLESLHSLLKEVKPIFHKLHTEAKMVAQKLMV